MLSSGTVCTVDLLYDWQDAVCNVEFLPWGFVLLTLIIVMAPLYHNTAVVIISKLILNLC